MRRVRVTVKKVEGRRGLVACDTETGEALPAYWDLRYGDTDEARTGLNDDAEVLAKTLNEKGETNYEDEYPAWVSVES